MAQVTVKVQDPGPVLQDFDKEAEQAAASLGATRWQTIRHVILPSLLPAVLTGFALAFARAVGEYGSVIFIAGNRPNVSEIAPLLIVIRLDEFRILIDDVDRRIVALLNERTRVVEEIGRVKREAKLAIYEPKRESEVFDNIASHNRGPLSGDGLKRIFERIIDEMRRVQKDRMVDETSGAAKETKD